MASSPTKRKVNVDAEEREKIETSKAIAAKKIKEIKLKPKKSELLNYVLLSIVLLITVFGYPSKWDTVTSHHVFYYGWITAISTGVGVLPFFLIGEPDKFWIGISNAVAGGMMLAASYSLATEGAHFQDKDFGILSLLKGLDPSFHSFYRVLFGFGMGILFIVITKKMLEKYEDIKIEDVSGVSAQKMILIITVMFLHSFSEGVGIGVSFGGNSGMQLGKFISLSLAMHNVPEGLAVALVMTSKNVGRTRTILWAIFTSLPQPIFAVPAYLFVEMFTPLLPAGLGFAAGAMTYVAIFELLVEAAEDTNNIITGVVATISALVMGFLQETVKVSL